MARGWARVTCENILSSGVDEGHLGKPSLGYSATQKDEVTLLAATWMGLEMVTLSEVSQTETNIIQYHLNMES